MSRNTLYSLVKVLSKKELEEIPLFLKMPYVKAKEHHELAFAAIQKAPHAEEGIEGLTKQHLFASAFGSEPYNDKKLRQLKIDLCCFIEDFLATKQLKKDEHKRGELLASALASRKDHELFKNTVSKRAGQLEKKPESGKASQQELAALYRTLYYHPETQRLEKNNDLLQRHIEHLETHFIISYLECAAESLLKKKVINFEEELYFIDTVVKAAEQRKATNPVIHSFLLLYNLSLDKEQASDLNKAKEAIFCSLKYMGYWEKQMAIKLLAQRVGADKHTPKDEKDQLLFEIYKKPFDDGFYKSANGSIAPNHFINMVIVAAKAREFEWAHYFLETKSRYLPKDEKKTVLYLCRGSVYYQKWCHKKDNTNLEEALFLLEKIPERCHEIYNLRKRSLSLRIHYELYHKQGDFDKIEKLTRNFNDYLKNNKPLSEQKKAAYLFFLQQFKSLCNLHFQIGLTKGDVDQYLKELSGNSSFPLYAWLVEKAEELKQSLHR